MVKTGKLMNFVANPRQQEAIDEVRKMNYKLNQSEVIRLLIDEGAKKLLGKERFAQLKD